MSRNDFIQFPQLDELLEIIAKEQQRGLPVGKENKHYPDFSFIVRLLHYLQLDTHFFADTYTADDLKEKNLPDMARELSDSVVIKIQQIDHILISSLCNEMYDYLSEEDKVEEADILFVFGSKSNTRIEKAVTLMKEGYAQYLLVSGSAPIYGKENTITEAQRLKQFALDHGINKEKILVEDGSISIPDNVRSSLNFLDNKGIPYNSFILVNSPFSQRRGWVHFKKYLQDEVRVIRANAQTLEKYSKDGWYKNEDGIRVIINEFIKMKIAVVLNTA